MRCCASWRSKGLTQSSSALAGTDTVSQELWPAVEVSMDYAAEADWDKDPGDDPTPDTKLFKVEERTEKFLTCHFSAAVGNPTRRQWKVWIPEHSCNCMP